MPDEQPAPTSNLYHYDDLHVGQRFISGTFLVDEQQIIAYAKQFDPQPFHIDPAAAQGTYFKGLVASGWHTASITMRLLVTSGLDLQGGMIGGAAELNWPRPT